MKKVQEHTIGSGKAPAWCRSLLMPYQKRNGQIGYVFYGRMQDFDLNIGDKLVHRGKNIEIVRGGGKNGCKGLSAADKHVR